MIENQPSSEKERAAEKLSRRSAELLSARYGPSYSNLLWLAKKAERHDLIPQIVKVGAIQGLENAILVVSLYVESKDAKAKSWFSHDFGYAADVAKEFDPEIGTILREIHQSTKTAGEPGEVNYSEILERLRALKIKHSLDLSAEYEVLRELLGVDPEEVRALDARAGEDIWHYRAR